MTDFSNTNHAPIIHYIGDGIQTVFSFPFMIFDTTQIKPFLDGIQVTHGYDVTGVNKADGGNITFHKAPENNQTITLKRDIPIRRISDFIEGGELSSRALNREFDQNTALLQQIDYKTDAAIQFPEHEALPNTSIPPRNIRANRLLGFDTDGKITTYAQSGNDDNGNSGGGNTDYVQDGTGAILRQLTDKVKETISAKDFGAIGDGVHDDTQAIQHALNAHHHVYLPSGTYRITETITITNHKTLYGDGASSIMIADNMNIDVLDVTGEYNHISDLAIQNGETAIRLYGKISPCRHNIIRNIVTSNQNTAIELDGYITAENSCSHNRLSHLNIIDPKQHGILLTRSGNGHAPQYNQFTDITIISKENDLSIAAISAEEADKRNGFTRCTIDIKGSCDAAIIIGEHSNGTFLHDISGQCHNNINGVMLHNGSHDTSLRNIRIQTDGTILDDESNGQYSASNIDNEQHDFSQHASFLNLVTHQQYYNIKNIALPGPLPFLADLTCSHYMVNTANGQVSFQLPKANIGNKGAVMTIIKTDNSAYAVNITEASGTGPNGNTLQLGSQHDRVTIISDGTLWRIMHTNLNIISANTVTGISNYSIDFSKRLHLVNAQSGQVNIQLPNASSPLAIGRIVTIKKTDSTSNHVRITEANGPGLDNVATVNLTMINASVTIASNHNTWTVLART